MNIFLDTSSLFKLYHQEAGSERVEHIFKTNKISKVFLSEISKVEFNSTVWKKARMQEITEEQGTKEIALFDADLPRYKFILIDSSLVNRARTLIAKYGKQGLRTLDSIQFATALSLAQHCSLFVTADKILFNLFQIESLPVDIS